MAVLVYQEKDRVILDLGGRRRDVLLGMIEAERLAEALDLGANGAELSHAAGDRALMVGEVWDVNVRSYDRKVAIRFTPPVGSASTRVPVPFAAARKLAGLIRFARQQAAYGIRFETAGGGRRKSGRRGV